MTTILGETMARILGETMATNLGQQLVLQLAAWTLAYIVLAQVLRRFSPTVQLHSIVHCFLTTFLAGITFHNITPGGFTLLEVDVYQKILLIDEEDYYLPNMVVMHSAGYFIADTIDIYACVYFASCSSHSNNTKEDLSARIKNTKYQEKRRMYVPHHVAALVALGTILFGCQLPLWGLWLLECGGAVHHIKYAAKIWRWSLPGTVLAEALYHTVYVWSRGVLFLNTTRGWFFLDQSKCPTLDVVCFFMVYVLVGINSIWWYQNARSAISRLEWRATINTGK